MQTLRIRKSEPYFLLALIFLFAAALTWVRTATVKQTYSYFRQEKELRKLEQELQARKVEWLKLTAPERLESLARKFELLPPDYHQLVRVPSRLKRGEDN